MRNKIYAKGILACAWLLLSSGQAVAQPTQPAAGETSVASPTSSDAPSTTDNASQVRPWAKGVEERHQSAALQLYGEGNREFLELRFASALIKYREAIKYWDHPAIRYNMAVALMNLGQILEAQQNLELGLAYGAAPLDEETYKQGLRHRATLRSQLAHFELSCLDPGVEVVLNGRHIFTSPKTERQFLLPGRYQLIATRDGFLSLSTAFEIAAGKLNSYQIRPTLRLVREEILPALELAPSLRSRPTPALTTKPAAPGRGLSPAPVPSPPPSPPVQPRVIPR